MICRPASHHRLRALLAAAALSSLALATGCTTAAGPEMNLATYGVTAVPLPPPPGTEPVDGVTPAGTATEVAAVAAPVAGGAFAPGAGVLPSEQAVVAMTTPQPATVQPLTVAEATSTLQQPALAGTMPVDPAAQAALAQALPDASVVVPGDRGLDVPTGQPVLMAAAAPAAIATPVLETMDGKTVRPPKTGGFLASLFKRTPAADIPNTGASDASTKRVQLASATTATAAPALPAPAADAAPTALAMAALPGVNTENIYADDVEPGDDEPPEDFPDEPVQLASATAAGLARLAPNGLMKQTDRVEVNCFKPELIGVLKSIERHYGKRVVVTSGYRSPKGNRRAGGSSRSLHMYCAAADVQIDGVGKWELAKYLRSMPNRGGVGTYCHTDSVHIDIGSKRDWNWRCRRK